MEVFRKSNTDVFCLDIRHFQACSLFAEIHGTIIDQHKSRTGHYKTYMDIKYEERKHFKNLNYKSKLVLYYLTSLIRDVIRILTASGCYMHSYQTRQIKEANN